MFKVSKVKNPRMTAKSKEVVWETVISLFLLSLFLLVSFKTADFFLIRPTREGKMEEGPTLGKSFRGLTQLVFAQLTNWSVVKWQKFLTSELIAIKEFLSYGDLRSLFLKTQLFGAVILTIAFLSVASLVKSLETSQSRDKLLSITRATLGFSFVFTILVMSVSPFFYKELARVFLSGRAFSFSPQGFWVEPFYPILINELVAILALATFLAWAVFSLVCFLTRKKQK